MTSPISLPEWRKAWKLDDKEWMKQRRKQWREIKSSVEIASWFLTKERKKHLKNFFMTGSGYIPELPEEEWEWYCYHPDLRPFGGEAVVLFECWLSADQSEENWAHIKDKHSDDALRGSMWRFRELFKENYYPAHGKLFGDVEERLYHQLCITRCRPEDYPDSYTKAAWSTYMGLLHLFIQFFLHDGPINNDHSMGMFVQEWCDSLEGAYEGCCQCFSSEENAEERIQGELDYFRKIMTRIHEVNNAPDKFEPLQVQIAKDVTEKIQHVSVKGKFKAIVEECLL